jgi:hypothetical protein
LRAAGVEAAALDRVVSRHIRHNHLKARHLRVDA